MIRAHKYSPIALLYIIFNFIYSSSMYYTYTKKIYFGGTIHDTYCCIFVLRYIVARYIVTPLTIIIIIINFHNQCILLKQNITRGRVLS